MICWTLFPNLNELLDPLSGYQAMVATTTFRGLMRGMFAN